MNIFVVLPFDDHSRKIVQANIQELGARTYSLEASLAWFVAFEGTTTELSESLGFSSGEIFGVVLSIKYYQGFAPRELWEWLDTQRANGR